MVRAILALLVVLAVIAPAAHASSRCEEQPLTQPFLPWQDTSWYQAEGAFEPGDAGWTLTGDAAVVAGNQPYLDGARSLSLPAGATATSAPVCVTVAHPTLRFFARNTGAALSPLTVSVLVRGPLGLRVELPIGVVLADSAWSPSPVLPVLANLLSLLGDHDVNFRFASSGGAWQIDNLYIDPYSKG